MKGRERVLVAASHVLADRVPVDLWALPEVMDSLRAAIPAATDEQVWQCLGVDLRSVWPDYVGPALRTFEDGSRLDWWGCRRAMMGGLEEVVAAPLAAAATPAEVEAFAWPNPDWFDVAGLRARCQLLGNYALVIRDAGPFATCVLRVAMYLRTMQQFFVDMTQNQAIADAIIEHITSFYLELNRRILEAVGDLTTIYFIADDVGVQDRLMMSPRMFRRFVKPSLTQFAQQAHRHGQKVMYHTCGAVRPLIPDFIDLGVDILNPIQVSAAGMDPAELKQTFGNALCFHGGLDVQTVLSTGSPEQVRAAVDVLLQTLGRGGGFILAPTNNALPGTPVENILAMYEAAGSLDGQGRAQVAADMQRRAAQQEKERQA